MKLQHIYGIYFSPTGGTETSVRTIADSIGALFHIQPDFKDLTLPGNRIDTMHFTDEDLVILGSPVYAGRVPNKIFPDLKKCLSGSGKTPVICISVYGNRSAGDSVRELLFLCEENGFLPVAAATIVSEHAFSHILATNRPDASDVQKIKDFASSVGQHLKESSELTALFFDRDTPVAPYYVPKKTDGTPAQFLKATPVTDANLCTHCGICASVCPMGSIPAKDCTQVIGICIKCLACIRKCPSHAKYFTDENFLSHVKMLEEHFTTRKEPAFYTEAVH